MTMTLPRSALSLAIAALLAAPAAAQEAPTRVEADPQAQAQEPQETVVPTFDNVKVQGEYIPPRCRKAPRSSRC